MTGSEWVDDRDLESLEQNLDRQAKIHENLKDESIRYSRLLRGTLAFFGGFTILKFLSRFIPLPIQPYSININDEMVTQRSADSLSFEGVSLEFGMGTPNKILALLVAILALFLILEFAYNKSQIEELPSKESEHRPTDYLALEQMVEENKAVIQRTEYLVNSMKIKSILSLILGATSIYILAVLTGHALFADNINPAFQILVLDIVLIMLIMILMVYLIWNAIQVAIKLEHPNDGFTFEAYISHIRSVIRENYNGAFGVPSSIILYAAWNYTFFTGLIQHLINIFKLWLYFRSGVG